MWPSKWVDLVWPIYSSLPEVQNCKTLDAKSAYDPTLPADPGRRTEVEELQRGNLKENLVVGFCIGGYVISDRNPAAFEMIFDPLSCKPTANRLPMAQSFWGVPALINRLIIGCDDDVFSDILNSGKWIGTQQDLIDIIAKRRLFHPSTVPIREAIDFTHACLMATVKAIKFSLLPRVCGGPIEIAVITTDRKFRWVQHKAFDAAIQESDP
jgi:hypothetical protein